MAEFSQRSARHRGSARQRSLAEFVAAHGRQPTNGEVLELRRRATLETRPAKEHHSLAEMTERLAHAGPSPTSATSRCRGWPHSPTATTCRSCTPATWPTGSWPTQPVWRWQRWPNVGPPSAEPTSLAEVHRQLHGVRFASPDERIAVAERTVDLALGQSLLISAPELHHTPKRFRRPDGTSRFRAKGHEVYTTTTLLEAEARLLDAGRQFGAPAVTRGQWPPSRRPTCPAGTTACPLDQAVADRTDRHLGAPTRRPGRAGRDGQVHHHGRPACGMGGRARRGFGTRPGPLRRGGRGAGERARHRHREHRQMALRAPPRSRARLAKIDGTPHRTRVRSHCLGSPRPHCAQRSTTEARARHRWRLRAGQLVIVDEAIPRRHLRPRRARRAPPPEPGQRSLLVGDQAPAQRGRGRRRCSPPWCAIATASLPN